MSEFFHQIGGALIAVFIFTLVVLGAGMTAIAQTNNGISSVIESPTITVSSTYRIILLASPTPSIATTTPTQTGTIIATLNEMNTAPSATITQTHTPEATRTSMTVQCQPPTSWVLYTVQSGDNLYRIGLKFRVSSNSLQQANCMGNNTTIISSEKVWVPNVPTSTPDMTETDEPRPTATQQPAATYTPIPTENSITTLTPISTESNP